MLAFYELRHSRCWGEVKAKVGLDGLKVSEWVVNALAKGDTSTIHGIGVGKWVLYCSIMGNRDAASNRLVNLYGQYRLAGLPLHVCLCSPAGLPAS